MPPGKQLIDIGKIGKSVGYDASEHLTQCIEQRNRSIIIVFALFAEDYGDRLLEVSGAVAQLETCVEQFVETGEKDVECLVQRR
jgi:hypothetical protein